VRRGSQLKWPGLGVTTAFSIISYNASCSFAAALKEKPRSWQTHRSGPRSGPIPHGQIALSWTVRNSADSGSSRRGGHLW